MIRPDNLNFNLTEYDFKTLSNIKEHKSEKNNYISNLSNYSLENNKVTEKIVKYNLPNNIEKIKSSRINDDMVSDIVSYINNKRIKSPTVNNVNINTRDNFLLKTNKKINYVLNTNNRNNIKDKKILSDIEKVAEIISYLKNEVTKYNNNLPKRLSTLN